MATANKKLIDRLKENIKKDEKALSIEQAQKAVKVAERDMRFEVSNAELAIDTAKENLEAVTGRVDASASMILDAQRQVALAEADYKAKQEIFVDRF